MTLNEFGKDEILRTLAWQPIAVAAGCLASFVIKIVFDYIPLRCDIDAPSMPPLLSLPLSMACDDSDGCVLKQELKRVDLGYVDGDGSLGNSSLELQSFHVKRRYSAEGYQEKPKDFANDTAIVSVMCDRLRTSWTEVLEVKKCSSDLIEVRLELFRSRVKTTFWRIKTLRSLKYVVDVAEGELPRRVFERNSGTGGMPSYSAGQKRGCLRSLHGMAAENLISKRARSEGKHKYSMSNMHHCVVYSDLNQKEEIEFLGLLLSQSRQIDELLERLERQIRQAVRRSWLQKDREISFSCFEACKPFANRESHGDIPLYGPLQVSGSSGFAWARRRFDESSSSRSRSRSSSKSLISEPWVGFHSNEPKRDEKIKRIHSRGWDSKPEAFNNGSDGPNSRDRSIAFFKKIDPIYQNLEEKIEFSGLLLSQSRQIVSDAAEMRLGVNFAEIFSNSNFASGLSIFTLKYNMRCLRVVNSHLACGSFSGLIGEILTITLSVLPSPCFVHSWIGAYFGRMEKTIEFMVMESNANLSIVIGAVYSAIFFVGLNNSQTAQPVVAIERNVFYRERAAGMYSSLPYAMAQVTLAQHMLLYRYHMYLLNAHREDEPEDALEALGKTRQREIKDDHSGIWFFRFDGVRENSGALSASSSSNSGEPYLVNNGATSSGSSFMNVDNNGEFASNTPIGEKNDKIERQICEGKLRLLDNDENPLVLMGVVKSDSEVEVVFDKIDNLRISTSGKDGSDKGYGTNSLLEQWRDSYPDNDD
ncbi:probable serine/threonine-protein kinase [Tanacetum coccineum]